MSCQFVLVVFDCTELGLWCSRLNTCLCLSQLKEFDKEMESFAQQLFEFPIHFAPSYPYMEDTRVGQHYMHTRCPAWCDRVVLSETAKLLVHQVTTSTKDELIADLEVIPYLPVTLKWNLESLFSINRLWYRILHEKLLSGNIRGIFSRSV